MNDSRFWFFLVLALFIGLVSSSPVYETNAQRFARGLPPAPPRFIRELRSSQGHNIATPVLRLRHAPSTSPSPLPYVTLHGKLQLRSKDGGVLGNIRNWATPGTISGTNFGSPDEDLLVKLTYNPRYPDKIDILATNPVFPKPFYVGAGGGDVSSNSIPELSAGSPNSVGFTNVEQTSPNALPTNPLSRDIFVESAIWSFDVTSKKLAAQWINADGTNPPTVLAYDIRENAIFFVGDIDAYNSRSNFPASAVDLFLDPI